MRTWWQYRSQRERWIIIIGGVIVILLLVFELIWSPLERALNRARTKVVNQQLLLQWTEQASREIIALKAAGYSASAPIAGDVLVITEKTLNEKGLAAYLRTVQQLQTDQLQLQFADIPFDLFVQWLQMLAQQYGISVLQINVSKTDVTGLVNINLTLRKAATI